jgi:hypothetical protein
MGSGNWPPGSADSPIRIFTSNEIDFATLGDYEMNIPSLPTSRLLILDMAVYLTAKTASNDYTVAPTLRIMSTLGRLTADFQPISVGSLNVLGGVALPIRIAVPLLDAALAYFSLPLLDFSNPADTARVNVSVAAAESGAALLKGRLVLIGILI